MVFFLLGGGKKVCVVAWCVVDNVCDDVDQTSVDQASPIGCGQRRRNQYDTIIWLWSHVTKQAKHSGRRINPAHKDRRGQMIDDVIVQLPLVLLMIIIETQLNPPILLHDTEA